VWTCSSSSSSVGSGVRRNAKLTIGPPEPTLFGVRFMHDRSSLQCCYYVWSTHNFYMSTVLLQNSELELAVTQVQARAREHGFELNEAQWKPTIYCCVQCLSQARRSDELRAVQSGRDVTSFASIKILNYNGKIIYCQECTERLSHNILPFWT
jgi:hypothetical protein